MNSNTEIFTIYVRLLDEGTDVMRPASAMRVAPNSFHLIKPEDYDSEYETWEFVPGRTVRCESRRVDNETILVAVELLEDET